MDKIKAAIAAILLMLFPAKASADLLGCPLIKLQFDANQLSDLPPKQLVHQLQIQELEAVNLSHELEYIKYQIKQHQNRSDQSLWQCHQHLKSQFSSYLTQLLQSEVASKLAQHPDYRFIINRYQQLYQSWQKPAQWVTLELDYRHQYQAVTAKNHQCSDDNSCPLEKWVNKKPLNQALTTLLERRQKLMPPEEPIASQSYAALQALFEQLPAPWQAAPKKSENPLPSARAMFQHVLQHFSLTLSPLAQQPHRFSLYRRGVLLAIWQLEYQQQSNSQSHLIRVGVQGEQIPVIHFSIQENMAGYKAPKALFKAMANAIYWSIGYQGHYLTPTPDITRLFFENWLYYAFGPTNDYHQFLDEKILNSKILYSLIDMARTTKQPLTLGGLNSKHNQLLLQRAVPNSMIRQNDDQQSLFIELIAKHYAAQCQKRLSQCIDNATNWITSHYSNSSNSDIYQLINGYLDHEIQIFIHHLASDRERLSATNQLQPKTDKR